MPVGFSKAEGEWEESTELNSHDRDRMVGKT